MGQVEVFEHSPGKVFSTHISLDVMALNWIEACACQARFGLTAAYATDAGTGVLRDADGRTRFDVAGDPLAIVSQAAVRLRWVCLFGTNRLQARLGQLRGEAGGIAAGDRRC